jgi:hypothetical protein
VQKQETVPPRRGPYGGAREMLGFAYSTGSSPDPGLPALCG